jgi:hypothetical protein
MDSAMRRGGTIDQRQMLVNEGALGKLPAIKQKIKRISMAGNREGTYLAYTTDTLVAKNEAERQFRRAEEGKPFSEDFKSATGLDEGGVKSLTPEQKMEASRQFADYIIGETHASALTGQQAGIQKHAVTRYITKFKSEPIKAFELIRRSLMETKRNPTPSNYMKAAKTLVFYGLIEGAMFYGIDAAWFNLTGNKKGSAKQVEKRTPNLLESEAKTNLDYVPIVGTAAADMIDAMKFPNSPQLGAVETVAAMPVDTVQNIIKATDQHSSPAARQKAMQKAIDDSTDMLLSSMGASIRLPRSIIRNAQ